MNLLVFQHAEAEHPGSFRDFFREDGVTVTTVKFDCGELPPDLSPFDFLLVMGGPQDVWQETQYPWLKTEKAAIREFVMNMERPFLGICLGHQLLAEAIGGKVAPAGIPEIGVFSIRKTEAGREDVVVGALPEPYIALQWHGAEVKSLPKSAEVLAHTSGCNVQAFRYGPRAYGFQGHVEATCETVPGWAKLPEYENSDDPAYRKENIDELTRAVEANIRNIHSVARSVYATLVHPHL